ncbi:uncharacterized protein B4U79_18151 [Dinothrombium tinctorium]|uniref:Peptidase S1 domain-containing protein n=1 Tax=Dinothrombium tinctorium TaxID=1965070 RepID=A0A443R0B8_9ACAR|nr:uncharacterized protein B4U79_18151 [Dinothrombium tinctorium]
MTVPAENLHWHENYEYKIPLSNNFDEAMEHDDIALIKVNVAFEFNKEVAPICLPPKNFFIKTYMKLTVIGYGMVNSYNEIITDMTIKIITNMAAKIITNLTTAIITNMTIKIITNMAAKIITNLTTAIITNMTIKIITNMATKIITNLTTQVITDMTIKIITNMAAKIITNLTTAIITNTTIKIITNMATNLTTEVITDITTFKITYNNSLIRNLFNNMGINPMFMHYIKPYCVYNAIN